MACYDTWPYGFQWLTWSPVLPEWAYAVKNPQHELHMIECLLQALGRYQDTQDSDLKALAVRVTALENDQPELDKLEARVKDLEDKIEQMAMGALVYDPTKGEFTNSENQSRRMMQVLGDPEESVSTVAKVANLTVTEFAERMNGEYYNQAFANYDGIKIPDQEVN